MIDTTEPSRGYMPKAVKTNWGTPRHIFDPLHAEFKFTLDVCAEEWNHKCHTYFNEEMDGLKQSWAGHTCWCNPPYGAKEISKWLKKAWQESTGGTRTVLLLPNTTDVKWFHEFVWVEELHATHANVQLRFFKGRISFDKPPGFPTSEDNSNVKGSILVIVNPVENKPKEAWRTYSEEDAEESKIAKL